MASAIKIEKSFPNIKTYNELDTDIDELILEIITENKIEMVIFIDSGDFGEIPGSFTWIEDVSLVYPNISTHEVLIRFYFELLQKHDIICSMLVIQPSLHGFEEGLTDGMIEFIDKKLEAQISKFVSHKLI